MSDCVLIKRSISHIEKHLSDDIKNVVLVSALKECQVQKLIYGYYLNSTKLSISLTFIAIKKTIKRKFDLKSYRNRTFYYIKIAVR